MALSNEEKQILEYAKANGKSALEAKTAIAKYRSEQASTTTTTQPVEPTGQPISNKITDAMGLGGATNVFGRMANTLIAKYPNSPLSKIVGQTQAEKDVESLTGTTRSEVLQQGVQTPTGGEMLGAGLQTAAIPAGLALTGGASLAGQAMAGIGLGYAYDVGQDLINKKTTGEILTPGIGTAIGGAAPFAAPAIGLLKTPVSKATNAITKTVSETIPESTMVQGAKQTATDLAERIPRFVGRVSEATKEQAVKAQRINTSTPAVAQALKVDLPEIFLKRVPKADPATKQAFREVIDIAEAPKTKFGEKANPNIVGGNYAVEQYDAIEKQRKTIGSAIGEATKRLPKNSTVNMRPAYDQLDNLLADQGIVKVIDEKGFKLDFSKSNLAPKQRQVVKDLYNLATEAGDTLSPYEVHKKDQLFSAIQREAKADQIADVMIDLGDGQKTDLFRAFRDVYSNQLDTLGPEIKDLNRKYRNVATLIDDIENSIFKTPDFEITKTTDPAEFAKVNLRRIFGEAQSSPAYEAIADEMDAISRQLGYDGPTPKEVAAFAQEIRALYPETIPKAGQQGIITNALDALGAVMGAGKADTRDQQKALRALIEATD
jgi:hypothetical protein